MRIKPKDILGLLKETFSEWSEDHAPRLGAALAYYTIFSIAPLLIIVIFVLSNVWVSQGYDVQADLIRQISAQVGPEAAQAIGDMLENAATNAAEGILPTVLGIVALLVGATTVFSQLQAALNTIWEIRPKPGRALKGLVMSRLLSFGLILTIGFLLLVSLVLSTALAALGKYAADLLPGAATLWRILELGVSFSIVTLLFAMIYRYLPDVEIAWRDVWMGAAVTALLFTLGKYALGLYLGRSTTTSAYGAAGSFIVLLLWVYYSAQIFFFGAEFTQVYARRYGTRIRPAPYAMRIVAQAETEPQAVVPVPLPPAPSRPSLLRHVLPVVAAFLAGRLLGRRR